MISKIIKKILWENSVNKIYLKLTWDRINPKIFNVSMVHFISLKKYVLNFIDKYVNNKDYILDFWCWNMIYKEYFSKKKCNYYWLDIWESPENNWNYIVYKWGNIPFEDNKFDTVFSTQVFEHLKDIDFYAKELERVTKNNWYILLTIAHVWEYHPYPKHYQNVMLDLIPEIFKNSSIIDYKWDTSPFQNICLFNMKYLSKFWILWLPIIWFINTYLVILNILWLLKISPCKYNEFTWNILLILKVNKNA